MAGVQVSRFYQLMNKSERSGNNQNIDSWDRFFNFTEQMYLQGMDVSDACSRMCNIMMTRDERMRKMIKANFTPEDYFQIRSRMVGTGMIGGKACGMLLARKIIENKCPDLYARLEPHDSYYIGSDVFYSYSWTIMVRIPLSCAQAAFLKTVLEMPLPGSMSLYSAPTAEPTKKGSMNLKRLYGQSMQAP